MTLHIPQKDSPSTYLTAKIEDDNIILTVADSSIFQNIFEGSHITRLTLGFDTATTETVTVNEYLTGNQIVVTRGTPSYKWNAGTRIARVLTAQDIQEIQDILEDVAPKTRSFLIQPAAGVNSFSNYGLGGLRMNNNMDIAYGYFSVPRDFLSNMTITPVFTGTPGASFNYWIRRVILSSGQGSGHDTADGPSTNITLNSNSIVALNEGTPLVLSSVAIGDYVLLMLTIIGDIGDLYCWITGFLVSYTAKF